MATITVLALSVATLVLAGVIYQAVGLARDARRYPPPGQLVQVDGHRLHVLCRGHGAPTVVLESAIAGSSLSWAGVQPEVARFTTVCAYDRAGLGWSEAPASRRTVSRVVDDLRAVTDRTARAQPCVIVGHSFGGLVCLAYAARYPQDVCGLVLIDPPTEWLHPDPQQAYLLRGAAFLSHVGAALARLGVVRACLALLTGGAPAVPREFVKAFGPTAARTLERLVGEVRKLPQDVHPLVQAVWSQPKCFRAMAGYLGVFKETAAAPPELGSAREVPVLVISSGDQPPDVMASHQALAQTSFRGRHIVAAKSGHWIQFDEPTVVVEAIRDLVDAARQPGRQGVSDGR